jgi:hypothetical protein
MIFEEDYTYITRRINNDDFVLLERDITLNNPVSIKKDNLLIDGNGCTIDAQGKTRIFNVTGKNVVLKNIIFTNANAIEKGLFALGNGYGGAIKNEGKLTIIDCLFINNEAKKNGNDILNKGELGIINCIFSQNSSNHSIFNKGIVQISEDQFELVKGGEVKSFNEFSDGGSRGDGKKTSAAVRYNFRYLDDLIHSGAKTICIESDITLDFNEASHYIHGIKIDVDDLTIDGLGHTIDADWLTRIFSVTGKNTVIKNLAFQNGFSSSRSKFEAEDSGYSTGRMDRGYGGAIYNQGELELVHCNFSNNNSSSYGGAVANMFEACLKIKDCTFRMNSAFNGGAIFNKSELDIDDSLFYSNGGLLYTRLTFEKPHLSDGGTKYGGAIINEKQLKMHNCKFESNSARRGGAINNYWSDAELKVSKCTFLENTSRFVGAINNVEGEIEINDSTFSNNSSKGDPKISSGAIRNEGVLDLNNCRFISNNKHSKAILNTKNSFLNVSESSFCDSQKNEISGKGYINYNNCVFNCSEDELI